VSNQRGRAKPSLRTAAIEKAEAQRAQAARRASRRRKGIVGACVAVVLVVSGVLFVVLRPTRTAPTVPPSADAVRFGCAGCHTTDGKRSEGPTWKGLYGSTVTLADGRQVVADEDYLRRSILQPQADIAQPALGQMPTIPLTQAQLDRLVAFIESLR